MNKKLKSIFIIASLIITVGVFGGCSNINSATKTTEVTKVEDKQEALKKELTPFLRSFVSTGFSFDYRKDTLDDLKKLKNFLTDTAKENEPDQKFSSILASNIKCKGIATVKEVKINSLQMQDTDTYILDVVVVQDVVSYIKDNKDYSNTTDNISGKVAIKKVDGKFLVDSYSFK